VIQRTHFSRNASLLPSLDARVYKTVGGSKLGLLEKTKASLNA
jgi:hypothetical protein